LDITARKHAEEALRRADQRKDEFLATLGHELRNPLAAIKGAVQLLQSDKVKGTTQEAVMPMLATQVGHMQRLVDDILDVARIVQDKINMRIETIALQDTIREALAMINGAVAEKLCHVELNLPEEPIEIRGDSMRLTQVFGNLVSNAVKYSASRCKIEIVAEATAEEAVVTVRDQGIGIAPELLPYVFDLFVQSTGSRDQSDGGLGLGLTVVKKLVAIHGGRVEARSEGEGKGSEFRVYLPLAR
jgi:signal transduction histidine kinase